MNSSYVEANIARRSPEAFFVNKDARNIHATSPGTAARRHVQTRRKLDPTASFNKPTKLDTAAQPWRQHAMSWRWYIPSAKHPTSKPVSRRMSDWLSIDCQNHPEACATPTEATKGSTPANPIVDKPRCLGSIRSPPPMDLDNNCHRLLHHYLLAMPQSKYRVNATRRFNLHRDNGYAMAHLHPANIHWILIAAEVHLAQQRNEPIPVTVYRRRALAYQMIGDTVNESTPAKAGEDGLLAAVASAIVMDSRDPLSQARSVHMAGLDAMMRMRGGPQTLRENRPLWQVVLWAVMLCDGGYVSESIEVEMHKTELSRVLRRMKMWNLEFRVIARGAPGSAVRKLATAWVEVLGSASHLRKLLCVGGQEDDRISKLCQLCTLLYLNLALWEHRDDLEAAAHFLKSLHWSMEDATEVDFHTGKWLITRRAVIGMLLQGGFEANCQKECSESEFWRSWRVMALLKALCRMGDLELERTVLELQDLLFQFEVVLN